MMRGRCFALVLTSMLAASCSAESVDAPPPAPMNWGSFRAGPVPTVAEHPTVKATEKERAVAEAYAKALASTNFAQLGAVFDEEAHFVSADGTDVHGREKVAKAHDALFGAFDQRSFVTSRVWLTDSSQVVEWTMTGVHARTWMGVPGTKKPVGIKGLSLIWTKDDGLVSEAHVYFDAAVVKAQLGAGPKQLAGLPVPTAPTFAPQLFEQSDSGAADDSGVLVVRGALDALENRNQAAYVGAFADDVDVYTLEEAQPIHGKAGALAYYKTLHKAIRQLDTTNNNAWAVAPFAIVEYVIGGDQQGPLGWVPVQHELRLRIVDIAEVRGGKIARIWRYQESPV